MKYYEIAMHCIKLKIFGDGVHWPGCQSIPVSVAFHAATFTNIIVVVVVVWSCEWFKTHPDVKQFGDTKEDPIHQIYSDANIQVRLPFLGTPETYQARQSWPPQNWLIIDVRTPVEVWGEFNSAKSGLTVFFSRYQEMEDASNGETFEIRASAALFTDEELSENIDALASTGGGRWVATPRLGVRRAG